MKKVIVTSASALLMVSAAAAMAQQASNSITVTGEVESICLMEPTNVDASIEVVADVQYVADLEVTCNSVHGAEFAINGDFTLEGQNTSNTSTFPYNLQVNFNGQDTISQSTTRQLTDAADLIDGMSSALNLQITDLSDPLYADTYTDTITVDVTAL